VCYKKAVALIAYAMVRQSFFGSVAYSVSDDCFFGKIIGTTDLVTFEGDSVECLCGKSYL